MLAAGCKFQERRVLGLLPELEEQVGHAEPLHCGLVTQGNLLGQDQGGEAEEVAGLGGYATGDPRDARCLGRVNLCGLTNRVLSICVSSSSLAGWGQTKATFLAR